MAMEIAQRDRASAHVGGQLHARVQWYRAGVHRRIAKRQAGSSACRDTACARSARGNVRAWQRRRTAAHTQLAAAAWALTVPFSGFCATERDAAHLVV